ncbi:MAG: glycosyltransferase family 39 protein [Patescibacteria group bacterium]|nr:glycosyltransferase family 39 protein [Patescibacteria group bacterium]
MMHKKKTLKFLKTKYSKIAIFVLVLIFTFVLRAHNYEKVPTSNHLDEMLYAWSGLYLIETGIPVSWSTLDYPKRAEVYKGKISYKGGLPESYVTLYKPWLDEPPLFSVIVGYFAHIYGASRNEFVPSSYIRLPVVVFSTLTSVMVFLIARFVSGYWIGILSMVVYGTVPLIVFASRTAMPENLIALLFSIMVYLLLKFNESRRFLYILPIPIMAGIAGLSKPTGFFLLPLALYMTFMAIYPTKKWKLVTKYIMYLIIFTLPFLAAFFIYGIYYDSEIFRNITLIQSSRPAGFGSLAWFFITPAFDITILRDSWYVFCLLSAAYFIFAPPAGIKRVIALSFVYWVAVVMISGGENDLLPWYRFPAFPMLAILGAWGLEVLVKRADFFATFLSAGLLLGNRMLLVNAFRPNIQSGSYRLILSTLMLPSLLRTVFDNDLLNKLSRVLIVGMLIVGIYFNVIYIYNAFEINCESKSCPIIPTTNLSTIHFPIIWRFFVLGEPKIR